VHALAYDLLVGDDQRLRINLVVEGGGRNDLELAAGDRRRCQDRLILVLMSVLQANCGLGQSSSLTR
jgi:hypothetical protein